MRTDARLIVDRLWRYCSVLRDDGLSYPDYVEQLTYLLFLKMAQEQADAAPARRPAVPPEFGWASLVSREGRDLHAHYSAVLEALGARAGMLGVIFRRAENKIRDPAKLRLLITDLIDQRNWSALDTDVKGDAYEGLLEKNAQDTKSGAGQYFTPRPVVRAIVECVRPVLGETVHDPACGTGGFLLAAHEYLRAANPAPSAADARRLRLETLSGVELVEEVTRLATMNLLLHGVGPADDEEGAPPVATGDSLAMPANRLYRVILTNPPFGKSSSTTVVGERGDRPTRPGKQALSIVREDFRVSSSNKQLNFLQHIASVLEPGGRAAVVVPDNVLTGGGAAEAVRRRLLAEYDVHTLLRLPPGLFYAQGVRAHVLFFDRPPAPGPDAARTGGRPARPATDRVWIYDLRAGMRFSPSVRPLLRSDLDDFVACYRPGDRAGRRATWAADAVPDGRWRDFSYEELAGRDECDLGARWLRDTDEVADGADLERMAAEMMGDLQAAVARMAGLMAELKTQ